MPRVSIVVSSRGVERAISLGPGLQETRESFTFLNTIWPEVQELHRTVTRKMGQKAAAPSPPCDA